MFPVTRYPMIFKIESGRVGYAGLQVGFGYPLGTDNIGSYGDSGSK